MGKHVVRGGLDINGALGNGGSDPVLTQNPATGEVGKTTLAGGLSTALPSAQFFIGDGAGIAQPRLITGDINFTNLGLATINDDVITNSKIKSNAAIAYSKLNLAGAILNTDIATGAAIAKNKIANGSANRILVNNASGVFSEQAAITANRLLTSDVDGLPTASGITNTTAAFLDPTSSVQTQLNNRLLFSSAITPVEGDLVFYNGSTWNRLPRGTSGQYLAATASTINWVTVPNGMPIGGTTNQYLKKNSGTDFDTLWDTLSISDITDITASAGQINVLSSGFYDATSSVQTQLTGKQDIFLPQGAIWVGNASSVANPLTVGTNGHVLTLVGGIPAWQAVAGTGTVTSISGSGGTTGLTLTGGPITATGTLTIGGTLDADNGGTGFTSYTIGDLVQANTTSTFSKLAAVATGNVLISGGVGTVSSWGKVGLTTHVSGTLPETSGGTNQTTYAIGDILYASGANTLAKLAAGTNTHVLTLAGGIPTWAAPSGGGGGWAVTGSTSLTGNVTIDGNFDINIGTSALSRTYGFGTGATGSGSNRVINIGTGGASGSINTVNIGTGSSGVTSEVSIGSNVGSSITNINTPFISIVNPATSASFSTATILTRASGGNIEKIVASGGGTSNFLRADGTWAAPSGGISNSAANNELMMSNGTNAVPSGVFKGTNLGDVDLGVGLTGANRTIKATGTAGDVSLIFDTKTTTSSNIQFRTGGTLGLQLQGIDLYSATNGRWFITGSSGFLETENILTVPFGGGGGSAALLIKTGDSNVGSGLTGALNLRSGNAFATGGGGVGSVNIFTGIPDGAGAEGSVNIQTRATGKIGFFNATAVVKATALTTALTTITHVAPGTPDYSFATVQLAGYGFSTQDEGNTLLSVVANIQARINQLETKLQTYGLLT